MTTNYREGDRIIISQEYHWAKGATGTISKPPAEVVAVSGPWENGLTRKEKTVRGDVTTYWVWFDEPQVDADGNGPYGGGSIWETALSRVPPVPN